VCCAFCTWIVPCCLGSGLWVMICALPITPWWRNSSGESLLSLCGPLSGKSCYSQTWHFSCVALEEKLNTDRAFDPQMLLAQSAKLRESLAGSLSHTPHIQWVRKFFQLLLIVSNSFLQWWALMVIAFLNSFNISSPAFWTQCLLHWKFCFIVCSFRGILLVF